MPILIHALWDFATFTFASATDAALHGNLPAEAPPLPDPSGLGQLFPVLLVLPNAIYGLWLMRNIAMTQVKSEP